MVRRIELTPALREALAAVDAAEADYVPGAESASKVELPKLKLADALLAAVRAAEARVEKLPERADHGVVYMRLLPERRRDRA